MKRIIKNILKNILVIGSLLLSNGNLLAMRQALEGPMPLHNSQHPSHGGGCCGPNSIMQCLLHNNAFCGWADAIKDENSLWNAIYNLQHSQTLSTNQQPIIRLNTGRIPTGDLDPRQFRSERIPCVREIFNQIRDQYEGSDAFVFLCTLLNRLLTPLGLNVQTYYYNQTSQSYDKGILEVTPRITDINIRFQNEGQVHIAREANDQLGFNASISVVPALNLIVINPTDKNYDQRTFNQMNSNQNSALSRIYNDAAQTHNSLNNVELKGLVVQCHNQTPQQPHHYITYVNHNGTWFMCSDNLIVEIGNNFTQMSNHLYQGTLTNELNMVSTSGPYNYALPVLFFYEVSQAPCTMQATLAPALAPVHVATTTPQDQLTAEGIQIVNCCKQKPGSNNCNEYATYFAQCFVSNPELLRNQPRSPIHQTATNKILTINCWPISQKQKFDLKKMLFDCCTQVKSFAIILNEQDLTRGLSHWVTFGIRCNGNNIIIEKADSRNASTNTTYHPQIKKLIQDNLSKPVASILENVCPICQDTINTLLQDNTNLAFAKFADCEHILCLNCMQQLITMTDKTNIDCPLCRQRSQTYETFKIQDGLIKPERLLNLSQAYTGGVNEQQQIERAVAESLQPQRNTHAEQVLFERVIRILQQNGLTHPNLNDIVTRTIRDNPNEDAQIIAGIILNQALQEDATIARRETTQVTAEQLLQKLEEMGIQLDSQDKAIIDQLIRQGTDAAQLIGIIVEQGIGVLQTMLGEQDDFQYAQFLQEMENQQHGAPTPAPSQRQTPTARPQRHQIMPAPQPQPVPCPDVRKQFLEELNVIKTKICTRETFFQAKELYNKLLPIIKLQYTNIQAIQSFQLVSDGDPLFVSTIEKLENAIRTTR